MTDHSWRDDAACVEQFTDMWFPAKGPMAAENHMAMRMCWSCPVREQCLTAALQDPEQYGIRGGVTAKKRRRMVEDAA